MVSKIENSGFGLGEEVGEREDNFSIGESVEVFVQRTSLYEEKVLVHGAMFIKATLTTRGIARVLPTGTTSSTTLSPGAPTARVSS